MADGNTEGTLRQAQGKPFFNKIKGVYPEQVPPSGTSRGDAVETTRQRLLLTTKAYILGAIHDATERKTTFRLSQKYKAYPLFIKKLLAKINKNAWIYKEGKTRKVYVVEFSRSFLQGFKVRSKEEKKYYIRGYFDSEGGLAKSNKVKLYIYFAQKNKQDLGKVRNYLADLGIVCGTIHNPSKKVDPNYWRFYISAKSYKDFAENIGSWHPIKSRLLRMKI